VAVSDADAPTECVAVGVLVGDPLRLRDAVGVVERLLERVRLRRGVCEWWGERGE
jgi:hypothetical protein